MTDSIADQGTSSFLVVPEPGQTEPVPGAFARLGSYSYIEVDSPPETLYPRQHTAEGGDYGSATGPSTRGIVLSCSGRLLINALEKSYIYSADAMHIDTASTFTLNSDDIMTVTSGQSISITSGNAQSITISADAGAGDVALIAMENTKNINGNDYEWITKDTYKFFECDTYTYRIGSQYYVGMSDSYTVLMSADFKVIMGASFSFMISFAFELTLSIEMKINIALSLKFSLAGFAFGIYDFKITVWTGGIKDGELKLVTAYAFESKTAKSKISAIDTEQLAYAMKDMAIAMELQGLSSETGMLKNTIHSLFNVT